MSTFFDDVGAFHRKFGQPVTNEAHHCEFPTEAEFSYRMRFMHEELWELERAYHLGKLPDAVDALVDLVYVALGTAHYFGAPFNEAWAAVQEANMQKVRAEPGDTDHKRGPMEPMRKPPGWKPPDIEGIIMKHNYPWVNK